MCISVCACCVGTGKGRGWGGCLYDEFLLFFVVLLTPSLTQLVKFPSSVMHGCTCKQDVFWSCNNLLSMPCVLVKILSQAIASAKKETKRLKGFKGLITIMIFGGLPPALCFSF